MKTRNYGVYTICNIATLSITEIDKYGDYLRLQFNNEPSRKHKVYWTNKGAYINYKGSRIYLDEFIRVGF